MNSFNSNLAKDKSDECQPWCSNSLGNGPCHCKDPAQYLPAPLPSNESFVKYCPLCAMGKQHGIEGCWSQPSPPLPSRSNEERKEDGGLDYE